MRRFNNKGFTLIELLAVVVIMGILMIVAIPAVTKYINNSKKDVFADNANAYINAARYSLLNGEYDCQAPSSDGQVANIPLSIIDIDKGNNKSSYNYDYGNGCYVKAEYNGGKIEYSICLVDTEGNGTTIVSYTPIYSSSNLVKEKDLNRKTVLIKSATSCTLPSNDVCKKNS